MNRGQFIWNTGLTSLAGWLGIHEFLSGCQSNAALLKKPANTRFLELELLTSSPLKQLANFYHSTLGLELLAEQSTRITIRAGETILHFIRTAQEISPFYHFAFNVPENKILKAREWQLKRTPLSTAPTQLIDESFPNDVRHFTGWNAHSIFFWDPAGNLVEYIARHDLDNRKESDFSSADILCASEIAFIVEETDSIAEELKSAFNLQQYRNGDSYFRAVGDENGLLLLIKKGRIWESHTVNSKTPVTLKTRVHLNSVNTKNWRSVQYPFSINSIGK